MKQEKNTITLNENKLKRIIYECIKEVIEEYGGYHGGRMKGNGIVELIANRFKNQFGNDVEVDTDNSWEGRIIIKANIYCGHRDELYEIMEKCGYKHTSTAPGDCDGKITIVFEKY